MELAKKWYARGSFIFAHLGYSMTEHISVDWILKLDDISGEVIPFQFPFSFTYEGWFDIIGIENGVFCIRYSEDGSPSRLAIWNPLTNRGHSFHDPLQRHCNDCAYLYAFAYFPNTLQYVVLHISNADEDADNLTLSMYTSFTRDWSFQLPCPGFATLLEPCCVSIKGVVYWLSSGGYEENQNPPYMVSFSIVDCTFEQIELPPGSVSHCQSLLVRHGQLCMAANNHDNETFRTDVWQFSQ
ncbi:hypothetical protein PIB30_111327, partial [Stylosanthes scabra]|nr:hypothetical protein [Stylosanthes scabra]